MTHLNRKQNTSFLAKLMLLTITLGLAMGADATSRRCLTSCVAIHGTKNNSPAMWNQFMWANMQHRDIPEARIDAVFTLEQTLDDAHRTPAGRSVIARNDFAVPQMVDGKIQTPKHDVQIHANTIGYIQYIDNDGFVMCDFDGVPSIIKLSAEDAVNVAALERRSRLHNMWHGDEESRPHHRSFLGINKNIAAKKVIRKAPIVAPVCDGVETIKAADLRSRAGLQNAGLRLMTNTAVPMAADVVSMAALCGTGGGSAAVTAARYGLGATAVVGGVRDIVRGEASYATVQSAAGAILPPGLSSAVSLVKNGHNVGKQALRTYQDPNAPGVDATDLLRCAYDAAAVTRYAVQAQQNNARQAQQNNAQQEQHVPAPQDAKPKLADYSKKQPSVSLGYGHKCGTDKTWQPVSESTECTFEAPTSVVGAAKETWCSLRGLTKEQCQDHDTGVSTLHMPKAEQLRQDAYLDYTTCKEGKRETYDVLIRTGTKATDPASETRKRRWSGRKEEKCSPERKDQTWVQSFENGDLKYLQSDNKDLAWESQLRNTDPSAVQKPASDVYTARADQNLLAARDAAIQKLQRHVESKEYSDRAMPGGMSIRAFADAMVEGYQKKFGTWKPDEAINTISDIEKVIKKLDNAEKNWTERTFGVK